MNYHLYALYAHAFDAIVALDAAGESAHGFYFHGVQAGMALRLWALARKLDVIPETIDGQGGSWTCLNVRFGGSCVDNITVHLNDTISMEMPRPEPEQTEMGPAF